jgi:hypothetical protein
MTQCTALSTVGFIPVRLTYTAMVDANDLPVLAALEWRMLSRYVVTRGKGRMPMHRMIVRVPNGIVVDHKDGNALNNKRENLRPATHGQNMANRIKTGASRSRYLGIKYSRWRKWFAVVRANGKQFQSQAFDSEESAAREYDRLARQHHGEFARLNFPNS